METPITPERTTSLNMAWVLSSFSSHSFSFFSAVRFRFNISVTAEKVSWSSAELTDSPKLWSYSLSHFDTRFIYRFWMYVYSLQSLSQYEQMCRGCIIMCLSVWDAAVMNVCNMCVCQRASISSVWKLASTWFIRMKCKRKIKSKTGVERRTCLQIRAWIWTSNDFKIILKTQDHKPTEAESGHFSQVIFPMVFSR